MHLLGTVKYDDDTSEIAFAHDLSNANNGVLGPGAQLWIIILGCTVGLATEEINLDYFPFG